VSGDVSGVFKRAEGEEAPCVVAIVSKKIFLQMQFTYIFYTYATFL
jgi:hypothetical protein